MALCNPFEYFFTWTIAPDLLDRYDPKAIYPKLRNFLSNAVRRKGLSYLIVPEYHEQKPGEDKPAKKSSKKAEESTETEKEAE